MAATYYILGFLLVFGLAGALNPILRNGQPAYMDEARANSRIVAGWPAESSQIPHQISVRMVNGSGSVSSCGGSVIAPNWVLTAAHCVANRFTFFVRYGLTNLTTPELIRETTRKYIHPRYIEILAGVQTDDIALLGVDDPVTYSPLIQPIRLQSNEQRNDVYTGIRLTVSGFGLTDDTWNGGVSSEILRWVFLRGITNAQCRAMYGNSNIIQDQTICAEYYNNTAQSSCQGDSGGPLSFVDEDGQLTQIGLVSFGSASGCNSPFPSAYVRPGHYHDWFLEVTGINFDWSNAARRPLVVNAEAPAL